MLPETKYFNFEFWFLIHLILMIATPVLAFISFLVILSDLNWNWIDQTSSIDFAHSILGICTVSFSILQVNTLPVRENLGFYFKFIYINLKVVIGLLRPAKDSPRRFIFNIFHQSFGFLTFLTSSNRINYFRYLFMQTNKKVNVWKNIVVTLFFGVSLSRAYLGKVGLGILLSWTVWHLFIFVRLEIADFKYNDSKGFILFKYSMLHSQNLNE